MAELRRRKAAAIAALDRYRVLITKPDLGPLTLDLARAAEAIGRRFEAAAWWELAARRDPAVRHEADTARARLSEPTPAVANGAESLADLLPTTATTAKSLEAGGSDRPAIQGRGGEPRPHLLIR